MADARAVSRAAPRVESRAAALAASLADAQATSSPDARATSMTRSGSSLHRRLLSARARLLLPSGARRTLHSGAPCPLPSSMARYGNYRGAPPSGVGHPTLHWRAAVPPSLSRNQRARSGGGAGTRVGRAWLSCDAVIRARQGGEKGGGGGSGVLVVLSPARRRMTGSEVSVAAIEDLIAFPF